VQSGSARLGPVEREDLVDLDQGQNFDLSRDEDSIDQGEG